MSTCAYISESLCEWPVYTLLWLWPDFLGTAAYGANTLAEQGITLDRLDRDGQVKSSASSGQGQSVEVEVLSETDDLGKVKVSGIVDDRYGMTSTSPTPRVLCEKSLRHVQSAFRTCTLNSIADTY